LRNYLDNSTPAPIPLEVLEEQKRFWAGLLRGISESEPAETLDEFLFAYPHISELALLTAFCELLAAHAEALDFVVGVESTSAGQYLGIRLPAAQVCSHRVRTALLDALEHRHTAPDRSYPAMFLPQREKGPGAALTLTASGFEYDSNRYSRSDVEALGEEFLQLIKALPPVPDRLTPSEAIAVTSVDGSFTYGQLLHRSQALAGRLIRRGAGNGTIVAIEMERSIDLPVAVLAIWQAGAAYLPIDPAYPATRKAFLLQDSGAAFSITEADFDGLDAETECQSCATDPDSIAYFIYTSGSSGEPKGVSVTHRSFANFLDSVRRKVGISSEDRFVAVTTLSFDISAMELFLPLIAGATLAIATREEAADGRRLAQVLERHNATMMFGTPATWRMLLEGGWAGKTNLTALCGGESLQTALADQLLTRTRALWNMFGPTETTVASTILKVTAGMDPVPIGRPLAKTQLYVNDPNGDAVPAGTEGELWIGGAGVARGYLNRPELTSERFTLDGRFRTGDLVRFLPDGNLIFLGRADEQIKIRGFRIEPGEIETALLRFPGVTQAAVLRQGDNLVAYVTPEQSIGPIRNHLAALLPPHMVPAKLVALSSFPITPNGKLDRRALSAATPLSEEPFDAPEGLVEKVLAQIFGEVLHLDCISVTDNFFHLGGHSLLATQVLSRVWEMWRVEIPTRDLFDSPSVRELALRIQSLQSSRMPAPVRTAPKLNPPLSSAQERIWFLHEFHQTEKALYNIPAVIRLKGPLDLERFARALNQVIARHETLRASFSNIQGAPVQTIHRDVTIEIRVCSLEESRSSASRPFDLDQAPLLRASLAPAGPNEWEFALTMHHIVSDGWSMGVFFRDLSAFYRGHSLPPLAFEYSDYAAAQRADAHLFDRDLLYWGKQLASGPAPLELAADRPRQAALTYSGAQHRFHWPAELGAKLIAFSRAQGVTPFITLLAAFNVLLFRYTNESDLVVGTPVANRSRVELEPLIGFFVNTLPLRAQVNPEATFREILRRTKDTALNAFAHGEIPFQKLVAELEPDRNLAHTPFFQVMFALQNAAGTGLDLPGVTASDARYEPEFVKLDLSVNIEQIEPAFHGSIDYNRDLFHADRILRLAGHLATLLEAALISPDCAIQHLPLLTPDEQYKLNSEWNQTSALFPEGPFIDVFRSQVARRPNAVAVQFENTTLTYAELDGHSDQCAGIAPGTLVPVVVERDAKLIPHLIAIWKAASAYVPIDPEYPANRQQFMREDIASGGSADGLAYVIYTSGSSGNPKGVRVPQRALMNLLEGMRTALAVDDSDVMIALATAAFDMSVPELWLPLYCGAKLVLATIEDRRDPMRLRRLMETTGATIMQGTPTLWAALLDAGWLPGANFKLLVGAEPLPESIAERLAALPCTVRNLYGPTETTVWSTLARVTDGGVTIGRPLANTRLFVLDQSLEPVPIGISGELYIAGEGVADGYWNRPDLTAEKFITLPNGERAFRTGDLVRYRADGQLEFSGRADNQVKLQGYRIELGEIEAALERLPSVSRAAVVIREDEPERKYLAAYLTGEALPDAELRQLLEAVLPHYMVPVRFIWLEALPLSANGKVDRRALPEPARLAPILSTAPASTAEELLQNIFSALLHVESVAPTDNFFHLGGHSLLAARAIARFRGAFGVELSLRKLFEAPTPRALAKAIAAQNASEPLPAIVASGNEDTAPLSFAQSRLWFLDRYYGGKSSLYNIEEAFRIRGPLDAKRLLRCLSEIVGRHSTLRTRFKDDLALIDAPRDLAWTGAPANFPFNLVSEWPIRASLTEHAPGDYTLFIVIHHIVSDAWSFGVFYRELRALYAGETLAPLAIQYSDFARWQRNVLTGERLENLAQWWREQLSGAPPLLELPADRARPAQQQFAAQNYRFVIPAQLTQEILGFSRAEDVTLFMLLLTAFQVLLARYTQTDDIVVGSPTANRMVIETEPLIGFFANTLVMRTKFDGARDFREALHRAREVSLNAAAHQDLPFEKLVEALAPARTDSYTPLFQVLFILQNNEGGELTLPGLEIEREPVAFETARCDLTFSVEERGGELHALFNYSAALFDRVRMERMAGHFMHLLQAAIKNPETPLARLPLLSSEEQATFETWNRSSAPVPAGNYLETFTRQVERTPNRIAIECNGVKLTYAELDGEASRLAEALGPDLLIPVVVHRDIHLVPNLLAAWKARSAYVPLDPDYPAERLDFIRQDLQTGPAPSGLAYVIYTSGSTGKPKGVRIAQSSVLNLLEAMRLRVPMSSEDVMLALATAAFDMSVPELWLPLYCGAKLVLGADEDRQNPERLRMLLERSGATVMQATPALWAALLDAGWTPPRNFKLLVGAEALPGAIAERLAQLDCTVSNMYGPTETTVWSTMARVKGNAVTIGRPLANTSVHVLDGNREPLPIGIPGELYIAGAGVAEGYWNRPELTAERFITLPCGERAYRTGDLVRFREDGELEFLRRLDTQVKLRGFRIELGEIETALSHHPGVTGAAAAIRGDSLIAWYTGTALEAELREQLTAKLPKYMVPSRFFSVTELPTNVHGKLDRSALTIPSAVSTASSDTAPLDPLELRLLPIWREALSFPDLLITDSFFDHGGHSLSAMRLVTRVERETGQVLPFQTLFSAPTVREVAGYLKRHWITELPPGLTSIQPNGARNPIFFFNVRAGCWNLAHALGEDQPLLGLEPAADALAAIRARQPHGPYVLAASGTGAEAALEAARCLAESGETVTAVALLDAPLPLPQKSWTKLFRRSISQPRYSGRVLQFQSAKLQSPVFENPAVHGIAMELRQLQDQS